MKYVLPILAIILLGYVGHLFLPWWSIVIVAGVIGLFTKFSGIRAFAIGFFAVTLLWGVYVSMVNTQNDSIIAERLGALFGDLGAVELILITTLLGGLLGGCATLTGNLGRKLVS